MPLRVMPRVGHEVTVIYLDARVRGTIREVCDGGRRLLVTTREGESLEFSLSPATATFTAGAGVGGPRLVFS